MKRFLAVGLMLLLPFAAFAADTPAPAAPAKELNALALMWTVIKGWFAGLFGKKT